MTYPVKHGHDGIIRDKNIHLAHYVQLVILCVTSMIQNALVSGSFQVCMSTIEKVFKLSNFYLIMVLVVYNTFMGMVSIPISYVAKNHKQIFISLGMLLIGVGSFIFILPALVKSRQVLEITTRSYLCSENVQNILEVEDRYQMINLSLMYIGYALIGIGSSPLYTVAIKYIFETFGDKKTPRIMSIYSISHVLGVLSVYIFSKQILSIPIFPWKQQDKQITPDHDTWVGAYWLMYLILGTFMWVLTGLNLAVIGFIRHHSSSESKDVLYSVILDGAKTFNFRFLKLCQGNRTKYQVIRHAYFSCVPESSH
ncbi:Solute carrier organic anion transporter family member 4A1 [Thelohanellus kitauei]|uniref:Solute carrier organic anion transporter family member 4A1 n=1 Tax=Thelohanellus kitauei TaxID=669202 RepID=A0A0C2MLV8_THEKT|nr:Solute carrier organic anion transporter family member 4A1 [Thelohanellus kitauei]